MKPNVRPERAPRPQKPTRAQRAGTAPPPPRVETPTDRARQVIAEKTARDRKLNQQRELQALGTARNAEVKQLIETHRVPRGEGDISYNFLLGKKIKRLYVNAAQQEQLIAGTLVIATQKDRHELVPRAIGEKIFARDPRCVVLPRAADGSGAAAENADGADADDPYAQFKVPDDLTW